WGHRSQSSCHRLHQLSIPLWCCPKVWESSWGTHTGYQLAVTQWKEEEPSSTSIYNLNDPWTPTVDFTNFINNESIAGQDLVAWVTAGFLHIPHSEDIPNTVTAGNGVEPVLCPGF
uniref:Amine oxidase n=1 Tax=Castor canadensis TaxID=51338 RepID=A0A8C0XGE3_CASCN